MTSALTEKTAYRQRKRETQGNQALQENLEQWNRKWRRYGKNSLFLYLSRPRFFRQRSSSRNQSISQNPQELQMNHSDKYLRSFRLPNEYQCSLVENEQFCCKVISGFKIKTIECCTVSFSQVKFRATTGLLLVSKGSSLPTFIPKCSRKVSCKNWPISRVNRYRICINYI